MSLKFNLIAAACENMGIGKNNNLPWRLKSEMAYFTRMTQTTKDTSKKNIVIMGRKTWDSIPAKFKPLNGRINFILSRNPLDVAKYEDSYAFNSLEEIIKKLQDNEFASRYEIIWVVGGSGIYQMCMKSRYFHKLYLTKIKKHFDCDTFFPALSENLVLVKDPEVPAEEQEENGIKFEYQVYENVEYKN